MTLQQKNLLLGLVTVTVLGLGLSGCAVVAVADLAVTTIATVVSTGVKATGAVVDMALPDKKTSK